jgi:hypothetical protein
MPEMPESMTQVAWINDIIFVAVCLAVVGLGLSIWREGRRARRDEGREQ